jgi:hypothetical protein
MTQDFDIVRIVTAAMFLQMPEGSYENEKRVVALN